MNILSFRLFSLDLEFSFSLFQKKDKIKIRQNDVIQNLIASKKDIMNDWYEDFLEKKIIVQKIHK
jgi:hypothetical protein